MYSELRRSAHRRGIYFDLNQGEFIQFCLENNLYRNSAKFTAESLTVDRIDPDFGYIIQNIQVIPMRENTTKENKHRKLKLESNPDDPF